MKRDLDLIRKIIFAVEDCPLGSTPGNLEIEGYTAEQIGYHSYLIVDAGFARGADATFYEHTLPNWKILHLTSAGHDFADAARSDSIWAKAKKLVIEKTGGATIDVMKQVLISAAKHALDL